MIFSDTEVNQFITDGFVIVRGGFSTEVAASGRAFIWERIGSSWADCTTNGQPMIHLKKNFKCPPFDRVMNPRLDQAIDQLLGTNRWAFESGFGWWPILFPRFPGPGGWHVDGLAQQRLISPEKGLVTLFLFSDIAAGDGGTPVVRGSHREVARMLARAEPDGLSPEQLAANLPKIDSNQIAEINGEAGDVALLHPLMIHGFGPNRGNRIRFACNPLFRLRTPMNLDRSDGDYSPVEKAILTAIKA